MTKFWRTGDNWALGCPYTWCIRETSPWHAGSGEYTVCGSGLPDQPR